MTLSNLLALNISNFHNLALFICQLFIDGQFRTGHILHDPNVFQVDQFITEIQSNCSSSVLWLSTDVNEPFQLPWKSEERTDHIIQLVFFDPENVLKKIEDFKQLFTFYRLVAFPASSTDVMGLNKMKTIPESIFSNSLFLTYNTTANGSACIYWIRKSDESNERSVEIIYEQDKDSPKNLFDAIFGKYEKNWVITIKLFRFATCTSKKNIKGISEIWDGSPFIANFYYRNLDAKFINLVKISCLDHNDLKLDKNINHPVQLGTERKFYSELTIEYKPIEDEQM